jgi:flagellar biosynthesis chaperone FliJ
VRDCLKNRQEAAQKWEESHPEGITRENLKEYQAFMRNAEAEFKQKRRNQ